jgi:hypothetical protein
MTNPPFQPPNKIVDNKTVYTFIETKNTNSKGERLSEDCYWYEVNGVKVPFSKGNIEAILM